jgi:hypothetical protein
VFSKRSPRTRSSKKRRKWLNFLPHVAKNQATGSIVVKNIATTIVVINAIAMIANPTIVIKRINATIVLDAPTRTQSAASPMTRRMIASAITSRKRETSPCIMTSLFVEPGQFIWKKELFLLKISFALSFLVLILLKQQELQQSQCGSR